MTSNPAGSPGPPNRPAAPDEEIQSAFHRTLGEGRVRLGRSWPGLLATGFMGGVDVGTGVLALLAVEEATGSRLLGALAFGIGFIALSLGRSELFTENFLVPVAAVVARDASVPSLLRLWLGTLVANLVAGWVFAGLVIGALPRLRATASDVAGFFPEVGFGWEAFLLAVIGGTAITLMTWMERGSDSEGGRLVAAVSIAFLLAAVPLNHVIVVSIEMFAALHAGAPFGYLEWLRVGGLATAGNMVGGLGLVTVLRLVQIGREEIHRQQERPAAPDARPSHRPEAGERLTGTSGQERA